MKTVLVLSVLLCVAFAAPAEDKVQVPEEVVEAPVIEMAVAAEEAVEAPENEMVVASEEAVEAPENEMVVASEPVSENQEEETPESRNSCPRGWHRLNSRCFLYVNRPSSWFNAEEYCVILGGHLASVSSIRDYKFLQLITNNQYSHAWLGGFTLQNRWLWVDGEGFYYSTWDGRYTTSSYPTSRYPCIFLQTRYGWGRSYCSSSRPFICSKSAFGC